MTRDVDTLKHYSLVRLITHADANEFLFRCILQIIYLVFSVHSCHQIYALWFFFFVGEIHVK
uniref:Uncharacterized protein n=1 Tax=Arundo donax TaxID=35708 RepID=A0A0A9CC40_ARUDO